MICELHDPGGSDLAARCRFPEASAVLVGNNPGWVFVDDVDRPRSALVWAHGMQGFYLVGDAENASFLEQLDTTIDEVLKPRLRELGVAWFEVSGDEAWNPVIEIALAKRSLERNQQLVYTLESANLGSATHCGRGDRLKLLSAEECLASDLLTTSREFLLSKLLRFWGSVDAFLGTGIGCVLVCEREIASLCFSGFVVGNVHVVDIETRASHQGKGYAQIVAHAFIAEGIERRLRLHWDCMAENTGSVRLAEKLGLTRSRAYTLYCFPL
ncbi:MAG: GNAT family N-acetyltransferase [Anaerolineae bacterium]|jgi:GNAT superfamily N-acetyltransferase